MIILHHCHKFNINLDSHIKLFSSSYYEENFIKFYQKSNRIYIHFKDRNANIAVFRELLGIK